MFVESSNLVVAYRGLYVRPMDSVVVNPENLLIIFDPINRININNHHPPL